MRRVRRGVAEAERGDFAGENEVKAAFGKFKVDYSLDDALQCANGNGFAAVHSDNDLPAVEVTPFLMTA